VTTNLHNPPHPGEVLRELCLEPLNLTVTEAARALGVTRKTLSSILNGRAGVSPEMAIRLSIAFNTSAESWLNQQLQYDLWHAERNRNGSASRNCLQPDPLQDSPFKKRL
jgi:addiction module HigA family antidote